MSELTRKQRYIGLVRSLLKVAIQEKQVQAGASLARLIARLENWDTVREPEPALPQSNIDVSSLLAHVNGDK